MNPFIVLAGLVVGVLVGGVVVWLAASLSLQKKHLAERNALETRTVAAESTVSTLRQQLEDANSEIKQIRGALDAERQQRISAETKFAESSRHIAEQQKLLDDAQQKLVNTFKALSDDALKSNNQAFLQLAQEALGRLLTDAKGDLGQRQEAIKGLVKPLEQVLGKYQEELDKLEQKRDQAYGEIKQQILSLTQTEGQLKEETENLVSALRLPQVRGRWGELTLKRVVELSGMSEHCDFGEQVAVESEEGRLKPDLVVYLPAGRQVVVDAKTPLNAYLSGIEARNEEQRERALREHATQLRAHLVKLSSKAYWNQFPQAPEFVVMFIPGESFFSAALRFDNTLIEDGIANRVVLASPTTIIALLRAIAYGWRQEQIAKNVQEVADIGKEVYGRFQTFFQHVSKLGTDLEQSIYSFNRVVGSLEGRILPGLKKFRELGATGEQELPQIEPIEQNPRQLAVQEREVAEANDSAQGS